MHGLGRRFVRLAATFGTAVPCLAAVALWGDQAWGRDYYVFVALTAAVLLVAVVARPRV